MAWGKLGTTTLTTTSDDVTVSDIADNKFHFVISHYLPSGNIKPRYRFNSDTGNNYNWRYSGDGASDGTFTSQDGIQTDSIAGNNFAHFDVAYIINISSEEKLMINHALKHDGDGATNYVKIIDTVGKWVNTSSVISTITGHNTGTGDFVSDSNVSVLGTD
jgi:hypothetical protein